MLNLPASECVTTRDDGKVCIAGTRIGLDVLIYDFRRGDARRNSPSVSLGTFRGLLLRGLTSAVGVAPLRWQANCNNRP